MSVLRLDTNPGSISLNHLLVGGGGLSGGGNMRAVSNIGGGAVGLAPVGGGPGVITNLAGGVQINPSVSPAVPQTDLLPLQGKESGNTVVVDLGAILKFVDMTATPWGAGKIMFNDPNGILHDLALFTVTKSTGSGFGPTPQLPPGRYTFLALDTLTDCDIYVQHYGSRNLL